MPIFGKNSLKQLDTVHPDLRKVLEEAIKTYDFSVICGHRGEAEQNKAVAEGKFKGSFKDFMGHLANKGYLQKGVDLIGSIKTLFGANVPQADSYVPTPPTSKVSTTTKVLIGLGGAAVLTLIIYGIYRATKK